MTKWELWRRSAVTALPAPLAAAPERVLINCACILIGLAGLFAPAPRSLLVVWPHWVAFEWAAVMVAGGAAALLGYWHQPSPRWGPVERVGYLAVLLATLLYGVGVIVTFGGQGAFAGIIYIGIATSKAIRLLVSTAARAEILRQTGDPQDSA